MRCEVDPAAAITVTGDFCVAAAKRGGRARGWAHRAAASRHGRGRGGMIFHEAARASSDAPAHRTSFRAACNRAVTTNPPDF